MKINDFLLKDYGTTILLSLDGKIYQSDGEELTDVTSHPLTLLSSNVLLEDGFTLDHLFSLLLPKRELFSQLFANDSFSSYMTAYYKIKESKLALIPLVGSYLSLRQDFRFAIGEDSRDKEIREELQNLSPTRLSSSYPVKIVWEDEDGEDIFAALSKRRRQEIMTHLENGTYESYIKSNNRSFSSYELDRYGPEELWDDDENGNRKIMGYNPEKTLCYSSSEVSMLKLLPLPLIVNEGWLINLNDRKLDVKLTNNSMSFFNLITQTFSELSWNTPEDREDQKTLKFLRAKLKKHKEKSKAKVKKK